jgi:hypothetical protein
VARKSASIVPLDQQLTEAESVVNNLVESSGDRAVALAPPTPSLPWRDWPTADFLDTRLSHLTVEADGDTLMFRQRNAQGGMGLGRVTAASLASLATHAAFPAKFVQKLSTGTQAAIINERLQAAGERHLTLAIEGDMVANIAREHREMIAFPTVCDNAWEAFSSLLPEPQVAEAVNREGVMSLRMVTPRMEKAITSRERDILQLGISVQYGYGVGLSVALHTTRLVCLNGMVADQLEWAWRKTSESKAEHQSDWLKARIEEMIPRFAETCERAELMANTPLPRNQTIPELIAAYGRTHGFQNAHVPIVIEAWNRMQDEEEDVQPTEWDLMNAFGRSVTHDPRLARNRDTLLTRLGLWLGGNEIVTARLRRSLAERLHVEIVPD